MKVCFVSLALYPCLTDDFASEQIGGAEVQQAQIAKGLVEQGVEVLAITEDYGQPDKLTRNGVTIFKTYRAGSGLPVLRFAHPKLTLIYRALKKADADIYYVRTASFLTAVVAVYCRYNRKRWVYAGAHDTDFLPGQELIPNWRDRWLYRYGLRAAHEVIVQTERQAALLLRHYNRRAVVIRNFIDGWSVTRKASRTPAILWVSTIRKWKRPALVLDIARRLPDRRFIMVGGPDTQDQALYAELKSNAAELNNVEYRGFLPLSETESLFDEAAVFLNTSETEGFPNTFLQAWRRGIPVVTYYDPDDLVEKNRLGCRVRSVEAACAAIETLSTTDDERSQHIRDYFDDQHSGGVVGRYLNILEDMA